MSAAGYAFPLRIIAPVKLFPVNVGEPPATAYYVSIAAVDAAGHKSLYAYPEYRCDSTNTCSQPADALNVTATKQ
jgi:hypothetical protein